MFHTKTFRIFLILAIVAILGSGIVYLSLSYGKPSKEFQEARLTGALIAQDVVGLSNRSVEQIKLINKLDQERNYTEALNVITGVIKDSQEIRNKAVDLSKQLEKMIVRLSDIKSFEARQAALESISHRLALISRLINYSAYLGQLLNSLQDKFTEKSYNNQVGLLINQINGEVTAINNFNRQGMEAMEKFDRIINK